MTQNVDDGDFDQPSLDNLISLRQAAKLSGLSTIHFRFSVHQGDIWGVEPGRN